MKLLAIDPGNTLSALVWYDSETRCVLAKMKIPNEEARLRIMSDEVAEHLVIEMAESFGAKVWSQVFDTVFWTGRFVENWNKPFTRIVRREVKMTITGSAKAKDGQIRQCIIEKFGGKEVAIGDKKNPGPLFGVTLDCWQALALAVTYSERGVE